MTCKATTGCLREKWTEIWDSGRLVTHIWVVLALLVFKGILSHLVYLSQNGLEPKTADRKAQRTEIWDSRHK